MSRRTLATWESIDVTTIREALILLRSSSSQMCWHFEKSRMHPYQNPWSMTPFGWSVTLLWYIPKVHYRDTDTGTNGPPQGYDLATSFHVLQAPINVAFQSSSRCMAHALATEGYYWRLKLGKCAPSQETLPFSAFLNSTEYGRPLQRVMGVIRNHATA